MLYQLEGRLSILKNVNKPVNKNVTNALPFWVTSFGSYINAYNERFGQTVQKLWVKLWKNLENQIDREQLKDLLIKSKDLSMFHQRCLLIRNAIDELLDTDEDLRVCHWLFIKYGYYW